MCWWSRAKWKQPCTAGTADRQAGNAQGNRGHRRRGSLRRILRRANRANEAGHPWNGPGFGNHPLRQVDCRRGRRAQRRRPAAGWIGGSVATLVPGRIRLPPRIQRTNARHAGAERKGFTSAARRWRRYFSERLVAALREWPDSGAPTCAGRCRARSRHSTSRAVFIGRHGRRITRAARVQRRRRRLWLVGGSCAR